MRRRRGFDDYAEVKRVYTWPAARGRGVAKALLRKIEDEARGANKSVLRLETGTYQQEAIGLYKRMGFRPRLSVRVVCHMMPASADHPS